MNRLTKSFAVTSNLAAFFAAGAIMGGVQFQSLVLMAAAIALGLLSIASAILALVYKES